MNTRAPLLVRAAWAVQRIASSAVASLTGVFANTYPSLDAGRKEIFNGWRPRYGTSNQILGAGLSTLSAHCRHIERFSPMARGVVEGLVSDVVGSGIDVLPHTGSPALDARVLNAWHDWAEYACADGSSLWQWQQTVMRELATSGNALARLVILPERAAEGRIPLALLPLEVEWVSEFPVAEVPKGHFFTRGLELDGLGRVQAYHLRNPEVAVGAPGERVAAAQMLHVYERRRPQQVWGEPILAPAVERCLQDARLIETELKAAIATAAPAVAIISAAGGFADGNAADDDGEPITDIPAGATVRLQDGENVATIENHRPSQQIAPFRQELIGDVAAACRTSRHHLTRDFSRQTFMNTRIEQLVSKRALAGLKEVVGCAAAGKVYENLFDWLLLKIGVELPRDKARRAERMHYFLRPDQPEYVDPTKDVAASINAIANNLSTYDIELSSRGKDFRQVFHQRQVENELLTQHGLPLPVPVKNPNAQPDLDDGDEPEDSEADADKEAAAKPRKPKEVAA